MQHFLHVFDILSNLGVDPSYLATINPQVTLFKKKSKKHILTHYTYRRRIEPGGIWLTNRFKPLANRMMRFLKRIMWFSESFEPVCKQYLTATKPERNGPKRENCTILLVSVRLKQNYSETSLKRPLN